MSKKDEDYEWSVIDQDGEYDYIRSRLRRLRENPIQKSLGAIFKMVRQDSRPGSWKTQPNLKNKWPWMLFRGVKKK